MSSAAGLRQWVAEMCDAGPPAEPLEWIEWKARNRAGLMFKTAGVERVRFMHLRVPEQFDAVGTEYDPRGFRRIEF